MRENPRPPSCLIRLTTSGIRIQAMCGWPLNWYNLNEGDTQGPSLHLTSYTLKHTA